MPRIRSIHPDFPQTEAMKQVSRDARLLALQLRTVADDAGRLRLNFQELCEQLYPVDGDASMCLAMWLDELVRVGVAERYRVEHEEYVRLIQWHQEQRIGHPTASVLPPSPNERPQDSGIHERARKLQGKDQKIKQTQSFEDETSQIHEAADFFSGDDPARFDRTALLNRFDRVGQKAEAAGSHIAALRATEMIAKYSGIAPAGADAAAAATPEAREAARLPSPEEANGVVPGASVS
jgi:hypothetical protein